VDEAEKVHDLFCKKVMGLPLTSPNGACVMEHGKQTRRVNKNKVLNIVMKCWLLERSETNPSRATLMNQKSREDNWIIRIKQELERMSIRYLG
jgi:hypothetical protein